MLLAPLGVCYAYEVEFLVIIHVISFTMKKGWNCIWLKNDSIYMVNLLVNKSLKVPSKLRAPLVYLPSTNFFYAISFIIFVNEM